MRISDWSSDVCSSDLRTFIVSLQGGKEETRRAAGDHLSNAYAGFSFGIEQPVAEGLSLIGGLSGELRRNDRADPLFLAKRQDEQIDLSGGAKLRLHDSNNARPSVTHTRDRKRTRLNP